MVELFPFGIAQSVSTLTTLLPFTDLGSENQDVTIFLENDDATNTCTLIVDVSHGGIYANSARKQTAIAQPLDECSIEIRCPNPFTWVRIAAQTASPGFPTVAVKWGIVCQQR